MTRPSRRVPAMTARRLVLTVAGGSALLAGGWLLLTGHAVPPSVGPVAEFPAHIDLGERQPGEAVTAILPLTNTGDRSLVIDQISTSCSCAGLEVEQNGRPARLTELTLPPGERVGLTFRLAVGVSPGEAQRVAIGFRTNDPRHPAAQVIATVLRVVGRPSAVPAELAFGSVPLGRTAVETFGIRANAVLGLRVVRVASSRPERLTATLRPADADAVARVDVTLATTTQASSTPRWRSNWSPPTGPRTRYGCRYPAGYGGRSRPPRLTSCCRTVGCRPWGFWSVRRTSHSRLRWLTRRPG